MSGLIVDLFAGPPKECKGCGQTKPRDQFFKEPRNKDGLMGKCLACRYADRKRLYDSDPEKAKSYALKWKRDNPDRWKDAMRKHRHGIPYGRYAEMLEAQDGGCAVCARPPEAHKSLHVDHDHHTGAVRSLLCDRCNRGLGYFLDDPALLEQAAAYLRGHRGGDAND